MGHGVSVVIIVYGREPRVTKLIVSGNVAFGFPKESPRRTVHRGGRFVAFPLFGECVCVGGESDVGDRWPLAC